MERPQFTDPYGSRLPTLERAVLRIRALEMLLILFYAEELKRSVVDCIQSTDRLRGAQRIAKDTRGRVDKALTILVTDQAITAGEKAEIVELIDYRNAVGHQVHALFADLSADKSVRHLARHMASSSKAPKYRSDALERLRNFRARINGLYRTHHYVRTLNPNALLFSAAEKLFLREIKRLDRRIAIEERKRRTDIQKLNAELSLKGTGLEGKFDPAGPYSKYDDGRLTRIGVEVCYRLFELGKSDLAVAHLTRLSLVAIGHRRKLWVSAGGKKRAAVDFASLPRRKFFRRYDD